MQKSTKDVKSINQFKGSLCSFWDSWGPILLTFSLYIGIRQYLAEARYIPSGSMLPGLQIHDRLLIEKFTYYVRAPRRGEIVVFKSPYSFDINLRSRTPKFPFKCSLLNFPLTTFLFGLQDPSCDAYIKRVVGIAGDKLIVNSKGEVFVGNKKTFEPFVNKYCLEEGIELNKCPELSLVVPKGNVVVLGDNRRNSWDSRFWPGGALLPQSEILGRAVWRFWPISRFGPLSP